MHARPNAEPRVVDHPESAPYRFGTQQTGQCPRGIAHDWQTLIRYAEHDDSSRLLGRMLYYVGEVSIERD
jgi:hypothetical protein